MSLAEVIRACRTILERHYGARLKGLILYGSVAHDQASPASDSDLLVLLSLPGNYFDELRQIIETLYPVQLESERLISAKPILVDDVERLWRSVKYEEIYLKHYETVREAKASLGHYFRFYNAERLHGALGYRTPEEVYRGKERLTTPPHPPLCPP